MSPSTRPTGDVRCPEPPPRLDPLALAATLFPPRDADPDTYRRHVAASPWPEVVFASAGTH